MGTHVRNSRCLKAWTANNTANGLLNQGIPSASTIHGLQTGFLLNGRPERRRLDKSMCVHVNALSARAFPIRSLF